MAISYDNKEVRFDIYCESCKHKNKKEHEEPCDECLAQPVALHTRVPVKYVKNGR